jgi:hypothetical protein
LIDVFKHDDARLHRDAEELKQRDSSNCVARSDSLLVHSGNRAGIVLKTYSGNGFCWPMIRRWQVETCSSHGSDSAAPEYALGRVKGVYYNTMNAERDTPMLK